MDRQTRKELRKELGRKGTDKLVRKLSRYDATKVLVTLHTDETSVSTMAAFVQFARHVEQDHYGLYFSGGSLRINKSYDEKVDTALDNEGRKRRYGYWK